MLSKKSFNRSEAVSDRDGPLLTTQEQQLLTRKAHFAEVLNRGENMEVREGAWADSNLSNHKISFHTPNPAETVAALKKIDPLKTTRICFI
jgi:hypothetical protein